MARRSRARDLAGLAALGALGYTFFGPGRDRKDGSVAPVEERDVRGAAPVVPVARPVSVDLDEDITTGAQRRAAEIEGANISEAERVAADAAERAALRGYDDMYANRIVPAAAPVRAQSSGRAASQRLASPDADFPRAGRTTPRPAAAAPAAPQARSMTREELIAQIPTGGTRTVEGGERVSGNEFTRNVGNILNAPVVGMLPVGRAVRGAASLRQPPEALAALPAPARGGASQARLPAPQARLTGPSRGTMKDAERAARQEALRQQVLRENAANYGLDPNASGYEAAMRALRKDLGGSEFTLKKKGGSVKAKPKKMASGGMSSASKRADGIATKGKTKCKMY